MQVNLLSILAAIAIGIVVSVPVSLLMLALLKPREARKARRP